MGCAPLRWPSSFCRSPLCGSDVWHFFCRHCGDCGFDRRLLCDLAAVRVRTPDFAFGPIMPLFLFGSYAGFVDVAIAARGETQRVAVKSAIVCGLAILLMNSTIWIRLTDTAVALTHFQRMDLLFGVFWSVTLLGVLNGRGWHRRARSGFRR
jgi:hypothetical protein